VQRVYSVAIWSFRCRSDRPHVLLTPAEASCDRPHRKGGPGKGRWKSVIRLITSTIAPQAGARSGPRPMEYFPRHGPGGASGAEGHEEIASCWLILRRLQDTECGRDSLVSIAGGILGRFAEKPASRKGLRTRIEISAQVFSPTPRKRRRSSPVFQGFLRFLERAQANARANVLMAPS